MRIHDPDRDTVHDNPSGNDPDCERRLALLIGRLPARWQTPIRWLRQPSVRWVRIPVGLLLILGSLFSILPVLGLWMLPLGLVLLAEDVPPLRRASGRMLAWIERRRPHWMGLPPSERGQAAGDQHAYSHSFHSGEQAR